MGRFMSKKKVSNDESNIITVRLEFSQMINIQIMLLSIIIILFAIAMFK